MLEQGDTFQDDDDDDGVLFDTELARVFAEYHDRRMEGEDFDSTAFLRERPALRNALAVELELADGLALLCAGDDAVVQRQFDGFELVREAGRGAMGIVYEARDRELGRRVALKVLPPSFLTDPRARAWFHREAIALGRLHHENIVRVYSCGFEGNDPYLAMEFVEGQSLSRLIRRLRFREDPLAAGDTDAVRRRRRRERRSPVDGRFARRVAGAFSGAARGLHHAHSQGVVHRDIKPSNLILTPEGRLRILDFGLATATDATRITRSSDRVGTLAYMSPEQLVNAPQAHEAGTDIYSLGASLYEVLTGTLPFSGRSPEELIRRVEQSEPRPVRTLNPHVSKDLETVVLKCLEKEPRHRYRSAQALANDLENVVEGKPIEARPRPWPERLLDRARRSPRLVGEVAVGILLVVALAAIGLWSVEERTERRGNAYEEIVREAGVGLFLAERFGKAADVMDPEIHSTAPAGASDEVYADFDDGGAPGWYETGVTLEVGSGVDELTSPGRLAMIEEELRRAVTLFPRRPLARYHLARTLRLQTRDGEARAELERALRVDPGFLPARRFAAALDGGGPAARDDDLWNVAERQSRSSPSRIWTVDWLRAESLFEAEDWQSAAEAYGRLAERAPVEEYPGLDEEAKLGEAIAHVMAGSISGNYHEALLVLGSFLHLLPHGPEPSLMAGKVLYLAGDFANAQKYYQRASKLLPEDTAPIVGISVSLLGGGDRTDVQSARALLEKARERFPDSAQIAYNLGRVYTALGDLANAEKLFRRTVELDPDHAPAWNNLGTVLDRRGELDEALACYTTATSLAEHGLAAAHYNRGWVFHRQRLFAAAKSEYELAIELGLQSAQVHYNLAPILHHLKDLDAAEKEYLAAITLDPQSAMLQHNLGMLYEWKRDLARAVPHYQRSIELRDNWPDAHSNLGWALDRLGRTEEALAAYDDAYRLDPNFPHAYNNWANLIPREEPPLEGEALAAAITRLERGVHLPDIKPAVQQLLERCRAALLPDVASYASVDALTVAREELLGSGEAWSYRYGAEPPPGDWTAGADDDGGWARGTAPFGFGEEDGVATAVGGPAAAPALPLYLRRVFSVEDPERWDSYLLRVRAMAGFVAYLNGREVLRVRAGRAESPLDAAALADNMEYSPGASHEASLDAGAIERGANVLAVVALPYLAELSRDGAEGRKLRLEATLRAAGPIAPDRFEAARESFRARCAEGDPAAAARLRYFEGRALELGGDLEGAAGVYREVVQDDVQNGRRYLEPFLSLGRCQRANAALGAAMTTLGDGIRWNVRNSDRLLDAWLRIALVDLQWDAAQTYAAFSSLQVPGDAVSERDRASWVGGLLGELEAGRPVRLNSGGKRFRDGEELWEADYFWVSGYRFYLKAVESVEMPPIRRALYATEKYFPESAPVAAAYRVPLPQRRYRVTLHFIEGHHTEPGKRAFDIRVEGTIKRDYEPPIGCPETVPVEVDVVDGELNVDFRRRLENPKISGLEIEDLGPPRTSDERR